MFLVVRTSVLVIELQINEYKNTECWWGSLRERGHWGDKDVNGRIILRWIFGKLEGSCGLVGVCSG
jgi:hypothetical protein